MSHDTRDFERFVEFLKRAGDAWHRPPRTPRAEMWEGIAGRLEGLGESDAGGAASAAATDEGLARVASTWHEPPVAPHDEMWGRIEAAWTLRRSAPADAREAGLASLSAPALTESESGRADEPRRRRAVVGWATGIVAAASLIIGIAIGRGSVDVGAPGAQGPQVAAAPGEAAPADVRSTDSASGDPRTADVPGTEPGAGSDLAAGDVETLETGRALEDRDAPGDTRLTAVTPPRTDAGQGRTEDSTAGREADRGASSRDVALRVATAKHLGQAETLLASFRSDARESADSEALAGWARDLLGQTRLLMDLPVQRSASETALLRDLELVLAQIARLGPDAPDFERDLIAEGLQRQGTLPRLRAATPSVTGASSAGT